MGPMGAQGPGIVRGRWSSNEAFRSRGRFSFHFFFFFFPGGCALLRARAGVCLVIVGHPLDLIKVKLQTGGTRYKGIGDATRSIVRTEGVRTLGDSGNPGGGGKRRGGLSRGGEQGMPPPEGFPMVRAFLVTALGGEMGSKRPRRKDGSRKKAFSNGGLGEKSNREWGMMTRLKGYTAA